MERQKIEMMKGNKDIDLSEGLKFSSHRSFTKIGSSSQKALQNYIRAVSNFAHRCKTDPDSLILEFQIESYALRRRLS